MRLSCWLRSLRLHRRVRRDVAVRRPRLWATTTGVELLETRVLPATYVATPGVLDNDVFPTDSQITNNPNTVSLRGYVRKANDTPANDEIQLGSGTYTLTRSGNDDDSFAGDLDIPSVAAGGTLTIVGAGIDSTIIDVNQVDRAFEIGSFAEVILRDLTIRNGSTSDLGGAIQVGGSGKLTLERVRIENSLSSSGGGAIGNAGSLTIIDSEIVGNTTQHASLFVNGGAILNRGAGVLNIGGSLLDNNQANGAGGAIYNSQDGIVTITNSTLSNNQAGTTGGGIHNVEDGADTAASVTLAGSTLHDNIANDQGGGLFNDGGGMFTITNSTFGFNRAANSGGAIVNNFGNGSLTNATVSGNFVTAGTIGGIVHASGTTALHNTIVANSVDTDVNADLDGAFVSGGHNLIEVAGSLVSGLIDTVNFDQIGSPFGPIDPLLGMLQNNGGPTDTFALNSGSPAIDAGDDAVTATLTTDQRGAGFTRQADGDGDNTATVDIGAFERSAAPPPAQVPELDNIETVPLSYTENDSPTVVSATITITDADSTHLTGAVVRITAEFQDDQDILAATTTGTNIFATFDDVLGALTLTGTDTVANYQAVLRSVTYVNSSEDPDEATRTVQFLVNDGTGNSNAITRDINVTATNEPVVVTPATFLVSEDARVPSLVGRVVATASSPTAQIRSFAITDGNVGDVFRIDSSGRIIVKRNGILDFETLATYTLTVRATDSLRATGSAVIQVNVADVLAPVVTPATFDVSETAANGTLVGTVAVTISGSANRLSQLGITGGNIGNVFRIDTQGRITVGDNRNLDFETRESYSLTVTARDLHGESGSAIVQINVLNEGGVLTVTLPDTPNAVTVKRVGLDLQVLSGGRILASERRAEITELIIVGGSAGDHILLDRSLIRHFSRPITIFGGAGNDTVDARVLDAFLGITFFGGSGNDTALGGAGDDSFNGGDDDDLFQGGAGNDELLGGDGDDTFTGGLGNDTMHGGLGFDRLVESGNVDSTLSESALIMSHSGIDELSDIETAMLTGGSGSNVIDARGFTNAVTLDGGAGNDYLFSGVARFANRGATHLLGGTGNDSLVGSDNSDLLEGGAGNDTLVGNDGNDALLGDSGNDSLLGGNGGDTLTGGPGDDTINGGASSSILNPTSPPDRLVESSNGNITLSDTAMSGLGRDRISDVEEAEITGGTRNQRLIASDFSGRVTLHGGGGSDTLAGGISNDLLDGGAGNDVIRASLGDDQIDGGEGTDRLLVFGFTNVTLQTTAFSVANGAGGFDGSEFNSIEQAVLGDESESSPTPIGVHVVGFAGPTTILGGSGDDFLEGGFGDDEIRGGAGNDTLEGGYGDDELDGGSGNDELDGGFGNDTLFGEAGQDTLFGGLGDDLLIDENSARSVDTSSNTMFGGDGDDTIWGGLGDNSIDGGTGDDRLRGRAGDNTIFGGEGNDTIGGGRGDDKLLGQAGDDEIYGFNGSDVIDGGSGADTLDGGRGRDAIRGGSGDDLLSGGFHSDTLLGSYGNDTIDGGIQSDFLLGEAGDDFIPSNFDGSTTDVVTGGGNGHPVAPGDILRTGRNDIIHDAIFFDFDALLASVL